MAERREQVLANSGTSPELEWIRTFVQYYCTDNITRVWPDKLNGVSLARVLEALQMGSLVSSEKCDGPGCICVIAHRGDDDVVFVEVFFEANVMDLEIRECWKASEERDSEHSAA